MGAVREETVDVVVVGSGGGGLVASMLARSRGLSQVLIEKDEYAGGTTALSHGALWLPSNPLMREAGLHDSVEDGMAYLRHLVGDQGPATTAARQEAFIRGGERLVHFLRDEGVPFRLVNDYPDYYPEAPGARVDGRMIACPPIDARDLEEWQDRPRPRPPLPGGIVMSSVDDFRTLLAAGRNWRARAEVMAIVARSIGLRIRRARPLVMGQAYVGHLLAAARRRNVRIELRTPFRELIAEDGRVAGVIAERDGRRFAFRARRGVLLNAGGFARNRRLRERFGPHPASDRWTAVIEGDTGDAFEAATAIGAQGTNLDKAYWLPGLMDKDGICKVFIAERAAAHSILVDSSGSRFANEAKSYTELGNDQYARHQEVPAIPAYLIIDSQHRRKFPLGETMPRVTPRKWLKSGYLKRANTIGELARQCGVDPAGLERTVSRFNRMALTGVDEDFGRGESAYDRVYADPDHRPNPCLGTIIEPPFYAAQMYPTDVGMAGGLLTDENAAVIGEDGEPIPGLYACGTTAASCAGDVYPGGGVSLGQSSVFGLIAAERLTAAAPRTAAPVSA